MLKGINFLNWTGRFSIFFSLAVPIYVFASENYKEENNEDFKIHITLASLMLFVILTTYMYWDKPDKSVIWKALDRLTVLTIGVLLLVYGDSDVRIFILLGIFFYLLGIGNGFQDFQSYIYHTVFRYFFGFSTILYLIDRQPWKSLFLSLLSVLSIMTLYLTTKDVDGIKPKYSDFIL